MHAWCFCFIATTVKDVVQVPANSDAAIAGMATVIVVLVLLLLMSVIVNVVQYRKHKHPTSYE